MKLIKASLVIILAVFITATLGFTSTVNSEDKIHKNPVIKTQTSQEPIDFMTGNDYLSVFPYIAHPGDLVYFKLRVYNNTPDNGYCGGSIVRFIMNGQIIDEVPFFLNNGEAFKDVSARLLLPEGEYSSLLERQQVTAQVQAIIDPYNNTPESDEGNNSATSQFIVEGKKPVVLQDVNQDATVNVAGLSAWSAKNDAPNDKISAALPGQKLNLKARIYANGGNNAKFITNVNAKFILDDIVIKEFKIPTTGLPSSGYLELNTEYYVPINATQPFDFTVILGNGSQASTTIPIIRWDVGINKSDMYWSGQTSGQTVAVPGQNIYPKAIIKNITFLKFPFDFNKIAYRVLIDGEIFYEDSFFLSNDSNYIYVPVYKVPAGRTTPIQYTIILDPYDQLKELNEANNTATITIPVSNTGSTGPDFSISSSDLSYISKPILPGSQEKLSAAILNNSNVYLTKDLRVQFKINGVVIADFKLDRHFLHPLQYYTVTKDWTVPQNLPDNSVFEVVLDPAKEFSGENASDNTASVILDIYGPDLEVTADCLSWLPKEPQAGNSVTLYAGIRNTGLASTKTGFMAKFFIDGNQVGNTVSVPPISSISGNVASCSWQIPQAPELSPIEWNTLKGEPGKLPLPSGATKNYNFKVQVDSGNQITETNEDNNKAEKNLTVYVPYNKAVVYVRAYDVVGNISGAQVSIKLADGTTATTLSANDGWCTFTGVPFGSYTITISADKYIVKSINSEVKTTSLVHYREVELTRDTDHFPYFTATASPLEGVTALKVDFNSEIIDPRITDSDFYFQWYDGANPISESKSLSHTFIEPGTHEVTFYIKKLNYDIVAFKSFNIIVNPPEITFNDEGRILNSTGNIFLDKDLILQDADKDGINQTWEDVAMNAVNPYFELDEGETWLTTRNTLGHKVANFVRVTPYPDSYNPQYILFYYCICWSRDYGRYINYECPIKNIFEAHNGDDENVVMAWKVVNNKTLSLEYVYTSAHGDMSSGHSAVWRSSGETRNEGKISTAWGTVLTTETMVGTLEFYNNGVKLYASQDKHAIYPSKSVGEGVHLVWIPLPLPGWFVMEDVGEGPILQFECYNAGEPDVHLMDDIGFIFPNERIWSGNVDNPGKFAGGLSVNENCPGIIADRLTLVDNNPDTDPLAKLLREDLKNLNLP